MKESNFFLEYSSKHSRNTKTIFGHIDTLRIKQLIQSTLEMLNHRRKASILYSEMEDFDISLSLFLLCCRFSTSLLYHSQKMVGRPCSSQI